MSEATSDSLGEVLVDETAPTGTNPTALTTYGWLQDSAAPYVASGAQVTGIGNTLSTGITISAPATAYSPAAPNNGRVTLSTSQTITTSTTPALVPGMDNYLDWNGAPDLSGFSVTAVAWGAVPRPLPPARSVWPKPSLVRWPCLPLLRLPVPLPPGQSRRAPTASPRPSLVRWGWNPASVPPSR